MAIHLFVKDTFTLVKIRVGSVYKFFDEIGKIIILSQVASYINERLVEGKGCKFKLPLELASFCSLAGDDPTMLSDAQIEQKMQQQFFKDSRYYTGYLSSLKLNQKLEVKKDEVDMKCLFYWELFKTSETMFHDCIVISVNFALRCCYFRRREQVIAFLRDRLHLNNNRAIDMKVKQGLPVSIF